MKSDPELIQQTLQGAREAYGELVRRYQDRLFHSMCHLAGSTEDAEDTVQEAFVQAYRKLNSFQGASAFYTWLYRIALNIVLAHRRREASRRQQRRITPAREDQLIDDGEPVDEPLLRSERKNTLLKALDALEPQRRTILILREMEGYDYHTIGEMLDLPPGTVRSRLHRARAELREVLDQSPLTSDRSPPPASG